MQSEKLLPLLWATDINFSYHAAAPVLSKIHLSVNEGESLGIIGESGSGKTTLLKILAGKLAPDAGEVFYKNENIYTAANQLIRGHDSIKIVDQDFDLMPYITVDENIIRNTLSLSDSGRKRLLGKLKSTLRLRSVGHQKAVHTSGGQKQRVALATAVAARPEVLLLDEPFANLDYTLKVHLIQRLKSQWRAPAMIVVAHEPADLLSLCNRIVVLKKGKIIQQGSSAEIYKKPKNRYVAGLLGPINKLDKETAHELGIQNRDWVRPHELILDPGGVPATVRSIQFCGSYYEVVLKMPGEGTELSLHASHHQLPHVGSRVKVSVRQEAFDKKNEND